MKRIRVPIRYGKHQAKRVQIVASLAIGLRRLGQIGQLVKVWMPSTNIQRPLGTA
jgi:hypothetical protein